LVPVHILPLPQGEHHQSVRWLSSHGIRSISFAAEFRLGGPARAVPLGRVVFLLMRGEAAQSRVIARVRGTGEGAQWPIPAVRQNNPTTAIARRVHRETGQNSPMHTSHFPIPAGGSGVSDGASSSPKDEGASSPLRWEDYPEDEGPGEKN
jgi:hypothetical protein